MSKIINGVASEYDMPMIYENKTMTNRLGNEEIFTRWQDPTIEQLQQENQQLKLDFDLYKDNHIYKNYEVERKDKQLDLYKSVIEEVREVIKNEIPYLYEIDKEYENVEGNTYFTYKEYDDSKLLQILDKVKENK